MKPINILLMFLFVFSAATAQNTKKEESKGKVISSFGEQIDHKGAISAKKMSENYAVLALADTTQIKFTAKVIDVCKVKGCWMRLELEDGQETMVRFKNYGFFMPKDIIGKEVIVNGLAFVEEMSVEDQQHYAKDGGQSAAEIAKITAVKKSYGFEADGVLLKK